MHSDDSRIGATLRLIADAERTEETGTIEIQRLLAWYYSTRDEGHDDVPEAA
jgi:hypothetical protein